MEFCQTGDSLILLLHEDNSHVLLTPDLDIDRDTLRMWQASPLAPTSTIQTLLRDQIRSVREQMNNSYGVLNGQPEAVRFISHGWHDLDRVTDILLFTDGLFLPKEEPGQDHDWQEFAALYRQGDLAAVRNVVRDLQKKDPGCIRYPRFKKHDDIAAAAIKLYPDY